MQREDLKCHLEELAIKALPADVCENRAGRPTLCCRELQGS